MRSVAVILLLLASPSGCAADDEPGQHEITEPGELLTTDGVLREPGWAPRQLLRWDPARVHDAEALRQWDYFTIMDERAAVNLTLVDLGFVRAATVSAVDLATGEKLESTVLAGDSDDFTLSAAVEGTAALTESGAAEPAMRFSEGGSEVTIAIDHGLFGGPPVTGALAITRRPALPYLSLATPFAEDEHQFFFEQKIPGLSADGSITIGDRTLDFVGATAVMDWGRGQWPAELRWRWAAAAGELDGVPVAFNLGDGFGDATAGTENLIVHDDVPHKLGVVTWTYDPTDPLADWTFASADGRVDLVLHPIAPELGGLDLGAKYQRVSKAYGRFSGTVVLDDGRALAVDGLLGFAEQVEISW